MKRFKKNVFLGIVCINFCIAGSMMAAEMEAGGPLLLVVAEQSGEALARLRREVEAHEPDPDLARDERRTIPRRGPSRRRRDHDRLPTRLTPFTEGQRTCS